ncbi:MAG: hypothetical protein Kapaf2KO_23670 [Candidatus Kapaibacteriales bacterium]
MRRLNGFLGIILSVLIFTGVVRSQQEYFPVLWETDGAIFDIEVDDQYTYIAGDFSYVGAPRSTGGIPADLSTGTPTPNYQAIIGDVFCSVADGNGGWYIGGSFSEIGGLGIQNIAHLDSNGDLIETWKPEANDEVRTLVIDGNFLYVGGDFSSIGGEQRNHIARLNIADGTADAGWNPNPDLDVNAIIVDGSDIYIGGEFNSVNGQAHNHLAKVNDTDGAPDATWVVNADGIVNDILDISAIGVLLVGGNFNTIGNVQSKGLAVVMKQGFVNNNMPYNVDGSVSTIKSDGTNVYVGGNFTSIDGLAGAGLSQLSLPGLDVNQGWDPDFDGNVRTIQLDGTSVYIGGDISISFPREKRNLIKIGKATANVDIGWAGSGNVNGTVRSLEISDSQIFVGGEFTSFGGGSFRYLARIINSSGALDYNWTPRPNNFVWDIELASDGVLVGGMFNEIGGIQKGFVAKLSNIDGGVNNVWDVNLDGDAEEILIDGNDVYISGFFTDVNNEPISHLAKVNLTDGSVDANWDTNIDTPPLGMAVENDFLYLGGFFSTIGGNNIANLARVNKNTAAVDPGWNPQPNGDVLVVIPENNSVYVKGRFTEVGATSINYVAKLDNTNGGVNQQWRPSPNQGVFGMDIADGVVYLGGEFSDLGGTQSNLFGAVDTLTGLADPGWNLPLQGMYVQPINAGSDKITIGGDFLYNGSVRRANLIGMAPTFEIDGLIESGGQPLENVDLEIANVGTVQSDANGEYVFDGLVQGSYTITPSLNGFRFEPADTTVAVNGDVSGVNFEAIPFYIMSGVITDTGGILENIDVTNGIDTVATDSNGRFTFSGLEAGNYIVTPITAGYKYDPEEFDINLTGDRTDLDIIAEPLVYIGGMVTDGTNPIEGIEVTNGIDTVATDATGVYMIFDMEQGQYTIRAVTPGYDYSPTEHQVDLARDSSGLDFVATLIPDTYTMSGSALDENNQGIPGVTITASIGGNPVVNVTTDINGDYIFVDKNPARYSITASFLGATFVPDEYDIVLVSDTAGIDFRIAPEYYIAGNISENGTGLQDIELTNATDTVSTDADGNYMFADLAPQNYTIRPITPGFTYNPTEYTLDLTKDTLGLDFEATTILETYDISGVITENGTPLVGIEVQKGAFSSVTDANGRFSFIGVPVGNYTVEPVNPDYTFTPENYTFNLTDDRLDLDFTAERNNRYSISGRCVDGAIPLEGIQVQNGPFSTLTDANGDFVFNNLAPGIYTIIPDNSTYSFNPTQYSIDLSSDTTGFVFDAGPVDFAVTGIVEDINGIPIENVLVTFGIGDTVRTSGEGRFSLKLPEGSFTATFSKSRYEFTPNNIDFQLSSNDYDLGTVVGLLINPSDCIILEDVQMGTTIYSTQFATELVANLNIVNDCRDRVEITDVYFDQTASSEFSFTSSQQFPINVSGSGTDTVSISIKYKPENLGRDIGRINVVADGQILQTQVFAEAVELQPDTKITYVRLRPSSNSVENGEQVQLFLQVDSTRNISEELRWTMTTTIDARIASDLRFYYPNGDIAVGSDVFLDLNKNQKKYVLAGRYAPGDDPVLGNFEFTAALAETDTLQLSTGEFGWVSDSIIVRPAFEDFVHVLPCEIDGKRLISRKKSELVITNIFPQPGNGSSLNIEILSKEESKIGLYKSDGTLLKVITIEAQNHNKIIEIDISGLASGSYSVRLLGNGKSDSRSFVITR